MRDELDKEDRRGWNRWTHRVNLAALGLPEDDEGEISSVDIAQLIVKSFETPGSVQLPDGLLRLRAHAIDDWRKRWLTVLRESAFEMTHDFHRTLRATTVSDVPCAPKELNEDDVKVSASLRVAFSPYGTISSAKVMTDDKGNTKMKYKVPTRGLLGLRNAILTATRGTAVLNTNFNEYGAWAGDISMRDNGSLVAHETGHRPLSHLSADQGYVCVVPLKSLFTLGLDNPLN